MLRLLMVFLIGPLLAGCGDSIVTLRNRDSGVIVKCSDARGSEAQKQCIEDFQSQGFEPLS